eukprot:TRINITY_DN11430_c0_g1_i1.p1 TRINITY_DN11430_c0_g1~~TRINITY_DN11430_c0_g1_i1.p1  ORF type:complete len:1147 (+),score=-179.48 TRINITY_DN11430_c0_g1_i1:63-3503(+)
MGYTDRGCELEKTAPSIPETNKGWLYLPGSPKVSKSKEFQGSVVSTTEAPRRVVMFNYPLASLGSVVLLPSRCLEAESELPPVLSLPSGELVPSAALLEKVGLGIKMELVRNPSDQESELEGKKAEAKKKPRDPEKEAEKALAAAAKRFSDVVEVGEISTGEEGELVFSRECHWQTRGRREEVFFPFSIGKESGAYLSFEPLNKDGFKKAVSAFKEASALKSLPRRRSRRKGHIELAPEQGKKPTLSDKPSFFESYSTVVCLFGDGLEGEDCRNNRITVLSHDRKEYPGQIIGAVYLRSDSFNLYRAVAAAELSRFRAFIKATHPDPFNVPVIIHLPIVDYFFSMLDLYLSNAMTLQAFLKSIRLIEGEGRECEAMIREQLEGFKFSVVSPFDTLLPNVLGQESPIKAFMDGFGLIDFLKQVCEEVLTGGGSPGVFSAEKLKKQFDDSLPHLSSDPDKFAYTKGGRGETALDQPFLGRDYLPSPEQLQRWNKGLFDHVLSRLACQGQKTDKDTPERERLRRELQAKLSRESSEQERNKKEQKGDKKSEEDIERSWRELSEGNRLWRELQAGLSQKSSEQEGNKEEQKGGKQSKEGIERLLSYANGMPIARHLASSGGQAYRHLSWLPVSEKPIVQVSYRALCKLFPGLPAPLNVSVLDSVFIGGSGKCFNPAFRAGAFPLLNDIGQFRRQLSAEFERIAAIACGEPIAESLPKELLKGEVSPVGRERLEPKCAVPALKPTEGGVVEKFFPAVSSASLAARRERGGALRVETSVLPSFVLGEGVTRKTAALFFKVSPGAVTFLYERMAVTPPPQSAGFSESLRFFPCPSRDNFVASKKKVEGGPGSNAVPDEGSVRSLSPEPETSELLAPPTEPVGPIQASLPVDPLHLSEEEAAESVLPGTMLGGCGSEKKLGSGEAQSLRRGELMWEVTQNRKGSRPPRPCDGLAGRGGAQAIAVPNTTARGEPIPRPQPEELIKGEVSPAEGEEKETPDEAPPTQPTLKPQDTPLVKFPPLGPAVSNSGFSGSPKGFFPPQNNKRPSSLASSTDEEGREAPHWAVSEGEESPTKRRKQNAGSLFSQSSPSRTASPTPQVSPREQSLFSPSGSQGAPNNEGVSRLEISSAGSNSDSREGAIIESMREHRCVKVRA